MRRSESWRRRKRRSRGRRKRRERRRRRRRRTRRRKNRRRRRYNVGRELALNSQYTPCLEVQLKLDADLGLERRVVNIEVVAEEGIIRHHGGPRQPVHDLGFQHHAKQPVPAMEVYVGVDWTSGTH
jgi:hypothetical protein